MKKFVVACGVLQRPGPHRRRDPRGHEGEGGDVVHVGRAGDVFASAVLTYWLAVRGVPGKR